MSEPAKIDDTKKTKKNSSLFSETVNANQPKVRAIVNIARKINLNGSDKFNVWEHTPNAISVQAKTSPTKKTIPVVLLSGPSDVFLSSLILHYIAKFCIKLARLTCRGTNKIYAFATQFIVLNAYRILFFHRDYCYKLR